MRGNVGTDGKIGDATYDWVNALTIITTLPLKIALYTFAVA